MRTLKRTEDTAAGHVLASPQPQGRPAGSELELKFVADDRSFKATQQWPLL
jgi:hypothetical protein